MSGGPDSQEVGLEAATLQRVRNSSLVESPGADNGPGLKQTTEAQGSGSGQIGRGASPLQQRGTGDRPSSGGECECRHE